MSADILSFGSINIDHIYQVPYFVQPGETLSSQNLTTVLGGKGANQSVAAARAGAKVAHVGNISDADQWAIDKLKESGVGVSAIGHVASASGHAIIQVDAAGENSILLHGGANQLMKIEQLEAAMSSNSAARYLLLQNECNLIAQAMQRAKENGLSVIYNPAPMTRETLQLPLDLVDVLVVNLGEGQALSGAKQPDEILEILDQRYGCEIIILTLGSKGAMMKATDIYTVPAESVKVRDTTAAGDTFVGYFAAGLVENLQPLINLQRASKASALAVSKIGAIPSIPNLHEVREFNVS